MANTEHGVHISFRWHDSDEYEARAIQIYRQLIEDGYTPRQIFSEALLRAEGYTPEMFRQQNADPNASRLINRMEDLFTDFAKEMLGKLEQAGVQARQSSTTEESADDDEYARNIARGFMNRRRG